jgi:glutamate-1-semialdehyde 2,1-aminomutase
VAILNRSKIKKLIEEETASYIEARPKSKALYERAKGSLHAGVPMAWMVEWPGALPVFLTEAKGARLTDVDGHIYVDLCLGDSGALTGHSPKASADAICKQAYKGMTVMLPTEDALWVGEELKRRFGLQYWQICMTATDANRFGIRMARHVTKRNLIVVFDGCYHGSLPETLVSIEFGEKRVLHWDVIGPLPNPASRVIDFNDLDQLEKALAPGDVACVLCEPAMTNCGIIPPKRGYHEALREITRRYGTLLFIDETHTISSGPGGLTRIWNLEPDLFTLGKAIAGGLPAAALGLSKEVSEKLLEPPVPMLGIGGTLSGSALQMAAIRATLENVLTQENYDRMIPIAKRLADGVDNIIKEYDLPWHVHRIGCRAEYRFSKIPPRNGREAMKILDVDVDVLVHVFMANRGVLLTPFHSMVLISPDTTVEDVDLHNKVFEQLAQKLVG